MATKFWSVIAVLAIVFAGLGPGVAVAQQAPPEQVRTAVGNIVGLENIGAKFVAIVAPDGRAVAFLGSRDDNFNQTYAKWYIGAVNGGSFGDECDHPCTVEAGSRRLTKG